MMHAFNLFKETESAIERDRASERKYLGDKLQK